MPSNFEGEEFMIAGVAPLYLSYARVEMGLSEQTIIKYRDCLRQIVKIIGDVPVSSVSQAEVFRLKAHAMGRGLSVSRQVGFLAALKGMLKYAQGTLGIAVMDPATIAFPRRPRRDVEFLNPEEVERFVAAIRVNTSDGLRFRALVEALLGTAARIGELLSLDRANIDFSNREARVVGKGGKERVLFFTDRALGWVESYLAHRTDANPALFATRGGVARLSRTDIWRPFQRVRKAAGLSKPVRPHLLRHTATQLLFNGCPVGHIKEILGHERLETTCRYYLGLDRRAAKRAHNKFLTYATASAEIPSSYPGSAVISGASHAFCAPAMNSAAA